MDKEFLGKVTLTDGNTISIYMPTMGDLETYIVKADNFSPYLIFALAAGMSVDEFRRLPLIDGVQIMNLLKQYAHLFAQAVK